MLVVTLAANVDAEDCSLLPETDQNNVLMPREAELENEVDISNFASFSRVVRKLISNEISIASSS